LAPQSVKQDDDGARSVLREKEEALLVSSNFFSFLFASAGALGLPTLCGHEVLPPFRHVGEAVDLQGSKGIVGGKKRQLDRVRLLFDMSGSALYFLDDKELVFFSLWQRCTQHAAIERSFDPLRNKRDFVPLT